MFCMKCKTDLVDCKCPDLHERLRSIKGPAQPAAEINLTAIAMSDSKVGNEAKLYCEDDQRAVVKILEDNSDQEFIKLKLEVVEQRHPHFIGKDMKPGDVFEVSANRKYLHMGCWRLEPL